MKRPTKLVKLHQAKVRYTKINESANTVETTERVVIPTTLPVSNVKAIDVTDLSVKERQQIQQLAEEYDAYVTAYRKGMFTFATWAEHTGADTTNVKWRTFKESQLELVENL